MSTTFRDGGEALKIFWGKITPKCRCWSISFYHVDGVSQRLHASVLVLCRSGRLWLPQPPYINPVGYLWDEVERAIRWLLPQPSNLTSGQCHSSGIVSDSPHHLETSHEVNFKYNRLSNGAKLMRLWIPFRVAYIFMLSSAFRSRIKTVHNRIDREWTGRVCNASLTALINCK